ncbi:MAG TPA: tRNA adenosine(34) deaminase TadA [Longimicrobiales bacterium]
MHGQFTPARADDVMWMGRALAQAQLARELDEVPIGAVIVLNGEEIAAAHNLTRTNSDPTAHAELLAIRAAAQKVGDWRVLNATLYVTLEPCAMCAGAMVLARIQRLVFAAFDPKAGMCGSLGCIAQDPRLNHRLEITTEVLHEPAAALLRDFFRERR